jgi:hypothetical protein
VVPCHWQNLPLTGPMSLANDTEAFDVRLRHFMHGKGR